MVVQMVAKMVAVVIGVRVVMAIGSRRDVFLVMIAQVQRLVMSNTFILSLI